MKTLLPLLCAFSAISAHAQQSPAPATPNLLNDAQAAVRQLPHDTIVFHWDPLPTPTTNYIAPNDPSGLQDVDQRIDGGVWNAGDSQTVLPYVDWLGYGMYAAIDPIISSIYGKNNEMGQQSNGSSSANAMPVTGTWRLIVLTLPAQMPYLDLTSDVPLSTASQLELLNASCTATTLYGLFQENSQAQVACRAPMRSLLTALNAGGVLYKWGSASQILSSVCNAATLPQAAFYVTESAVTQNQVALLSSGLPTSSDSASPLRTAITSLWGLANNAGVNFQPWPAPAGSTALPTGTLDPASLASWAQANLFGCSAPAAQ